MSFLTLSGVEFFQSLEKKTHFISEDIFTSSDLFSCLPSETTFRSSEIFCRLWPWHIFSLKALWWWDVKSLFCLRKDEVQKNSCPIIALESAHTTGLSKSIMCFKIIVLKYRHLAGVVTRVSFVSNFPKYRRSRCEQILSVWKPFGISNVWHGECCQSLKEKMHTRESERKKQAASRKLLTSCSLLEEVFFRDINLTSFPLNFMLKTERKFETPKSRKNDKEVFCNLILFSVAPLLLFCIWSYFQKRGRVGSEMKLVWIMKVHGGGI